MKVNGADSDDDQHDPDQVDASRDLLAKVAEQANHDGRDHEEQGIGYLVTRQTKCRLLGSALNDKFSVYRVEEFCHERYHSVVGLAPVDFGRAGVWVQIHC